MGRDAALRPLGKMLIVGVRGAEAGDPSLEEDLDACVRAGVGGVILFDRDVHSGADRNVQSADQVARLTARIRDRLGADVLICVDQEGGLVQRLGPRHGFLAHPPAEVLASMAGPERRDAARALAGELSAAGVDVNFAPCVDLTVEPECAVIGALGRSFGRRAAHVAACARDVINEHAFLGIACFLKHFPGHGSVLSDSHLEFADITETWREDDELAPYRTLLDTGAGVMTGHLIHRGLDPDLPASLSEKITEGLLRGSLGFDGVVATDSLDMEGVRARWSLDDSIKLSIEAGADLVVHACNSKRGEYAPDVVDALERAAASADVETLIQRAARSQERVRAMMDRLRTR